MKNLTLAQLTILAMRLAKKKKFGIKPAEVNTLEKIALIHSEISEAMEAYRLKKFTGKDGFNQELADAVIRILHLAGVYKVDLEKEVLKKLNYNKKRKWDWKNYNETHG